ncbi:hypothetical protein ACNO8X_14805 [Mycobacterium sp. PDNC021]|uniref:hypothetical protein n=1 Tax=Mycobacterium sp. PDNC021 TaxID=3391399 RepID=UPI0010E17A83
MTDQIAHADAGGEIHNDAGGTLDAGRTRGNGSRGQTDADTANPGNAGDGGQPGQIPPVQDRFVRRCLAALVVGDLVIATGAPFLNKLFKGWNGPLEAAAAAIAVGTFLGVWLLQRHGGAGRHDRNSMRDAITAAFVVTYLVIVGWATFSALGNDVTPFTKDLVANFTLLVGVVVGGYFGADAVKQVTLINAERHQQGRDVGRD